MKRFWAGFCLAAILSLMGAGQALGQEERTRTTIRKGKVVYVSPGILVVRSKEGVRKFTPEDWKDIKVEKDGQMISPDRLEKGDVVTATIITKEKPTAPSEAEMKTMGITAETAPVTGEIVSETVIWTEIRSGKVVYVSPDSLLVRRKGGGIQKFTPEQWKDTKIEKDGQMIEPNQLQEGDVVTATFVTKARPVTVSDAEARAAADKAAADKAAAGKAAADKAAADKAAADRAAAEKRAAAERAAADKAAADKVAADKAAAERAAADRAAAERAAAEKAAAEKAATEKLPKTSSALPLMALGGLAFLGLGATLNRLRRHLQ